MRRPLTVLAAAVVLVLLAATPKSILDSYRLAIASRKIPANMEFDYTVTKSGPARIVTEQHRVYWTSSGEERNDTISVNGTPVIPARSQMLHRTVWPYDAGQFAVTAEDYDATPAGMAIIASRRTYAFALARNTPADFMLKSLYVDAKTKLPIRETFAVAGQDCEGSGSIDFTAFGAYWLPSFVSVACTQTGSGASPPPVFKESIRFSGFQFPSAIPSDVFSAGASTTSSGDSVTGGP